MPWVMVAVLWMDVQNRGEVGRRLCTCSTRVCSGPPASRRNPCQVIGAQSKWCMSGVTFWEQIRDHAVWFMHRCGDLRCSR